MKCLDGAVEARKPPPQPFFDVNLPKAVTKPVDVSREASYQCGMNEHRGSAAASDETSADGGVLGARRGNAGWILAGWAACSIFFSIQAYVTRCGTTRAITMMQSFAYQVPIACVLTVAVLWVIRLSRHCRIERHNWRSRVILHVGYCLLFTIVVGASEAVIDATFKQAPVLTLRTLQNILYAADRQISLYLAVLFIVHTWDYYLRFRDVQLRASRLQTDLANAKLELLKSQIQPHFLFNALNTISSVISENPALAERLVARLGQFLRATLVQTDGDHVPLEQELDLLDAYLDIQRLRFEDHLRIELDIEPSSLDALVPALLLQPIAENAIKYGIDPRAGVSTLTIAAHVAGRNLMLTVRDSGGDASTAGTGLGIGLANTRLRLQLLYGDAQSLDIGRSPAGGFVVSLCLPLVYAVMADELDPDFPSSTPGVAQIRWEPSA